MNRLINAELHSAVECNDLTKLRDLLNKHDLYNSEGNGYVLLRRSIIREHREMTMSLLSSGANVNSKRSKTIPTNTPLHFAILNRDIEIIKKLLDKNADIDAKNDTGLTPLLCAININSEEIVDLLLKRSSSLNYYNRSRAIPISVERGFYKMTEKFLQLGANVNSTCANSRDKSTSLHIAATKIDSSIVELLLNNGADVNSKTTEGLTPMHFASKFGHTHVIKLLINKNADVNARANNLFTPLYFAVQNSHREAAKCLMDHGAIIDAEFKDGETVLNLAVCNGLSMIVEDILKCCPDVNNASNKNAINIAAKKSSYGSNLEVIKNLLNYGFSVDPDDVKIVLENAIKSDYIQIIQHLIDQQHGLQLVCLKENCNFLHIAVKNKKVEIAELLLNYGADVNATDEKGKSAIYYSTQNSDVMMTKLLLSHGAIVQKSPELLRVATKKVCKEIVEILLQNKVDIEATDEYGRTALHLAASCEYASMLFEMNQDETENKTKGEIAKLLLSMGANVDAKTNTDKLTPLHIACQKGFLYVVEVLLEYKADVNCAVKDCSPLMIAADIGNAKIMQMLILNGAEVNSKRINGDTALHIVARKEYTDALKILLENGADVFSKNIRCATPLNEASRNPDYKTMCMLLEYGSPIDLKDIEGKAPLHMATLALKADVIKLLLASGSDINILTNNDYTVFEIARNSFLKIRFPRMYDSDYERTMYYHESDEEHDRGYEYYDYDRCGDFDRDYDRDNKFIYDNICDILKSHIVMLKTANLYVNKRLDCIDSCEDSDFKTRCEVEVEALKLEKIENNKLSLYDILTTTNIDSLANYARNEDITRILELNYYKTMFPIYAPIIERNFAKGTERRLLLEEAQEFFKFNFKLPYYDCSDHILRYLSDGDLENIINVSKTPSTAKDL